MRVETTAGCPRAISLLYAVEEAGIDYDPVARAEGSFLAEAGTPGPALTHRQLRAAGSSP